MKVFKPVLSETNKRAKELSMGTLYSKATDKMDLEAFDTFKRLDQHGPIKSDKFKAMFKNCKHEDYIAYRRSLIGMV